MSMIINALPFVQVKCQDTSAEMVRTSKEGTSLTSGRMVHKVAMEATDTENRAVLVEITDGLLHSDGFSGTPLR